VTRRFGDGSGRATGEIANVSHVFHPQGNPAPDRDPELRQPVLNRHVVAGLMSAIGTKQTFAGRRSMSAFGVRADIAIRVMPAFEPQQSYDAG
jgi:hypothetical protein